MDYSLQYAQLCKNTPELQEWWFRKPWVDPPYPDLDAHHGIYWRMHTNVSMGDFFCVQADRHRVMRNGVPLFQLAMIGHVTSHVQNPPFYEYTLSGDYGGYSFHQWHGKPDCPDSPFDQADWTWVPRLDQVLALHSEFGLDQARTLAQLSQPCSEPLSLEQRAVMAFQTQLELRRI